MLALVDGDDAHQHLQRGRRAGEVDPGRHPLLRRGGRPDRRPWQARVAGRQRPWSATPSSSSPGADTCIGSRIAAWPPRSGTDAVTCGGRSGPARNREAPQRHPPAPCGAPPGARQPRGAGRLAGGAGPVALRLLPPAGALGETRSPTSRRHVNRWVQADLRGWLAGGAASTRRASAGAMMLFGEKYGERVRMVVVGDPEVDGAVSVELCGGTHVAPQRRDRRASMITAEEAVSAGVRRITALVRDGRARLSPATCARPTARLGQQLGAPARRPDRNPGRQRLQDRSQGAPSARSAALRDKLAAAQTAAGAGGRESARRTGFTYASNILEGLDASALRTAADNLLQPLRRRRGGARQRHPAGRQGGPRRPAVGAPTPAT